MSYSSDQTSIALSSHQTLFVVFSGVPASVAGSATSLDPLPELVCLEETVGVNVDAALRLIPTMKV